MTEQDDTMAAETLAPDGAKVPDHTTASPLGADADTTWVPADPATVDAYAWGTEPGDDELNERLSPPLHRSWLDAWGIAASVLVIGAVIGVAIFTVHAMGSNPNANQVSALTTVAPAVVPSAPVVPDIHHVGPAPAPATALAVPEPTTTAAAAVPEFTAERDQWVMNYVELAGVTVANPARLIEGAHQYCLDVAAGHSRDYANSHASALSRLSDANTDKLTTAAMMGYPHC
jgi:hypothetical protein